MTPFLNNYENKGRKIKIILGGWGIYLFVAISAIVFFISIFFWWQIRSPNSQESFVVRFEVRKGEGIKSVAGRLKELRLISNPFYFKLYLFLSGREFSIQPGLFDLSRNLSIREIADQITKARGERVVTIFEGLTLKDVEWKLVSSGVLGVGELVGLRVSDFPGVSLLESAPSNVSLEGYLFPDTYRFYERSNPKKVVLRFLNNLDSKLSSGLKKEILRQRRSIFEILIMASIIEKETRGLEDQKIVSGILWKRLKLAIPLQADATLVYITSRLKVYESDKKIVSPYNTYYYKDLPLAPIANPGLGAIEAAVFPKSSPYLYYLSTRDGRMVYSRTLEEHNLARRQFLSN